MGAGGAGPDPTLSQTITLSARQGFQLRGGGRAARNLTLRPSMRSSPCASQSCGRGREGGKTSETLPCPGHEATDTQLTYYSRVTSI